MTRSKVFILLTLLLAFGFSWAQQDVKLHKKDRRRDVEIQTSEGRLVLRLSDETPLHRDNFLRLVKSRYFDSVLFHRVIKNFMIQAGDPGSRAAKSGVPLGNGGPGYTIPAEMKSTLFHKKGALAAARMGDQTNPQRASSGSQFYIVHGRPFTDAELDSIQRVRLKDYQLPLAHREVYKTLGGTPQLDQNYTVFGELISGFEVLDIIANTATSRGSDRDRPVKDMRIIRARLIKRKN